MREERYPYGKPWDRFPWNGDEDAYREDLYAGISFGLADLPSFAREWLDELARVGYRGTQDPAGLPRHEPLEQHPTHPRPLPLHGEVYPVRFGDARPGLWLRLDAGRTERGYRAVAVSDAPLRTDAAIVAALTALEGRPLDTDRLRDALDEEAPGRGESAWDAWTEAANEAIREGLQHHGAVDFVLSLLRHHRPAFDDLPAEERRDFIVEGCSQVNSVLESLGRLLAFLEYGAPGRRNVSATGVAQRDVRAAVLRDVDGLTIREIARELGVPEPADFGYKADFPSVRKMVSRGREILYQALGKEGWEEHAREMRAEAERWSSLTAADREAEFQAEALGIPPEEARRHSGEEAP